MITKDTAINKVASLVDRFEEQKESYKRSDYNETLTRRDFIDPFFKALGWDIDNEQGYAESYREVIHEDKIKISGATKAPDYSFRLSGGKRLFFVEAKKPSVLIKDDITPAYQVRRYGWSAKLPISIITDFEEFAVYDCTKKPNPSDKASHGRIKYLTYSHYLNEFDFIWDTFSKERVLKGSFDKYVSSDKQKRGTSAVDKEFLASLDNWRTSLAGNIALRNDLDADELNYVVQAIIDRIIFLRIAEDRSVEAYGSLKEATASGEYYQNLLRQFHSADQKYNSGLFDFRKDKISQHITIDNKVIKGIVSDLYYPVSPYEFSVIPVEILGSAYEQFLGKTITLSISGRAVIEEKPEVRKAGGVYYTPQYIVDYIVKNTVGKLVEGKKPEQISKVKIVDPACGSGSFLIGAYDFLLQYHKDYYTNNGKLSKGSKGNPLTPDGNLTTAEKKRILLNNIFGVDLDANAVEVTKLSLLLKCMEGETEASINTQLKLFHERVLPTLDDNVKCGNSLIDVDFYESEIDFGEEKKIKPFNWQKAFPQVFKQGGFDAVIGNPPYVRQELLGEQKNYFQKHYKVFHGMADLYSFFFEKGISLLNDNGVFGIIVANKWMRANYGEPLRKWLKNQVLLEITDFGSLPVFQSAITYPCIVIASKSLGKIPSNRTTFNCTEVKTLDFGSLQAYVSQFKNQVSTGSLQDSGWHLSGEGEQQLLKKIRQVGVPLSRYVNGEIYYGIKTGLNPAFIIDEQIKQRLIELDKRSAEVLKPFLAGKDVKRYSPPEKRRYLIFFPKGFTNIAGNKPKNGWAWLTGNYPAIAEYLKPFEEAGKKRYDQGDYWWELRACEYYEKFDEPKIIIPTIVKGANYTYDTTGYYSNDKTCIIPTSDKYLLGVMSSKTIDYFIKSIASTKQGGYYEYKPMYIAKIPIRDINAGGVMETKMKQDIVESVDKLLDLNMKLQGVKLDPEIQQIQSRIDYYEQKINQLVYQLYGLTEDEIAIIEGKEVAEPA